MFLWNQSLPGSTIGSSLAWLLEELKIFTMVKYGILLFWPHTPSTGPISMNLGSMDYWTLALPGSTIGSSLASLLEKLKIFTKVKIGILLFCSYTSTTGPISLRLGSMSFESQSLPGTTIKTSLALLLGKSKIFTIVNNGILLFR